jgi:hypothetical protein
MYRIKNTERNSEKASDFETFSMLYLFGVREDRDKIDLVLIDCFNDVTGSDDKVSYLWDVQSKGHKRNTPLQIGKHLLTLYENFLSKFPFRHLILFLETAGDHVLLDVNLQVFGIENFTKDGRKKIRDGLVGEYSRRNSVPASQVPSEEVDSFLSNVDFVVCAKDKVKNIKNLIEFRNRDIRSNDFFVEIFNEIRGMQSKLKNTNVEDAVLHTPCDVLNFKKHISRNQVVALLVNRLVGVELFSNHGIPVDFLPYVTELDREDIKDLMLQCTSAICRTFFDKNNKVSIWLLLEEIISIVVRDASLSIEDVLGRVDKSILMAVPTLDQMSALLLIARIKDGLE